MSSGSGPAGEELRVAGDGAQAQGREAADVDPRLDDLRTGELAAVPQQAAVAPDLEADAAGGGVAVVDGGLGAQDVPVAVEVEVDAAPAAYRQAALELQAVEAQVGLAGEGDGGRGPVRGRGLEEAQLRDGDRRHRHRGAGVVEATSLAAPSTIGSTRRRGC